RRDSQGFLKDQPVQKDHVKPSLRFRNIRQQSFEVGVTSQKKKIKRTLAVGVSNLIHTDRASYVTFALEVLAKIRVGFLTFFCVLKRIGVPIEISRHAIAKFLEVKIREPL